MEITITDLKELYENNSNEFVCEKLNVSMPTLLRYVKNAGIPLKGKGGGMVQNGEKKIQVVT